MLQFIVDYCIGYYRIAFVHIECAAVSNLETAIVLTYMRVDIN